MNLRLHLFFLAAISSFLLPAQTRWEADYLDTTWHDQAFAHFETPNHRHLLHFGAQGIPGQEFRKYTMLLDPKGTLLALDTAAQHLQSFTGPWFFPLQDSMARMYGFWENPDSTLLWRSNIDNSLNHLWQGAVSVPYAGYLLQPTDSTVMVFRDKNCGIRLYKAKINGDILWQKTVEETDLGNCAGYYQTVSAIYTDDGGYLVGATFRDFIPNTYYFYLVKFSATDSVEWKREITIPSVSTPHIAQVGGQYYTLINNTLYKFSPSGQTVWTKTMSNLLSSSLYVSANMQSSGDTSLLLCGTTPTSFGNENGFFAKIDTLAQLEWIKHYGRNSVREELTRIYPLSDGGHLLTGKRFYQTFSDIPADAFFVRTDPEGNSESNLIRGKVFLDENANCLPDPGEPGIPGHTFQFLLNGVNRLIQSGSNGSFSFPAHEGNITVKTGTPSPYFEPCWTSGNYVATQHDTFDLFFPMKPIVECPLFNVELAATTLLPCEESLFRVKYRNIGTLESVAVVTIQLDSAFTLTSADLPYANPLPGVFQFAIGNVGIGGGGGFGVRALLSCDALPDITYCNYASVSPNDYCLSDPELDIEQPHWDEFCRTSTDQILPLGKSALEGTNTKVTRDSINSYLIHFQNNTGNVVDKVVITDTISSNLEITSVEPGAGSHAFQFEFIETNAIRFTLENAALPDAASDPLASQGFVRFKVRQKPGLNRNASIKNTAWLRLDDLSPAKTNTVSQLVQFPPHVGEVYHTMCAGDLYQGVAFFADTILQKIYQKPLYDTLNIAHLTVLPVPKTELFFNSNSWAMYNGTMIYGDTTVTQIYVAANGCDSVVTLHFDIINSVDESAKMQEIQAFPNPASHELFIQIPSGMENNLMTVINSLGQKMPLLWVNTQAGIWRMDVRNWERGIYFVYVGGLSTSVVIQ